MGRLCEARQSLSRTRRTPARDDGGRRARGRRVTRSRLARHARQPEGERGAAARVLAAAERLGYRPNAMARGLASRRTQTLGVLLNELHNPFYAEIMDGIEESSDGLGYRLLASTGGRRHRRGAPRDRHAARASRRRARARRAPRCGPARCAAAARHVPVVVVARAMRAPAVDWIVNDEPAGRGSWSGISSGSGIGASPHRRRARRGRVRAVARTRRAMRRGGARAARSASLGRRLHGRGRRARAPRGCSSPGTLPTAIFAANDFARHRGASTGSKTPGCACRRTSRSSATTTRSSRRCTTSR